LDRIANEIGDRRKGGGNCNLGKEWKTGLWIYKEDN